METTPHYEHLKNIDDGFLLESYSNIGLSNDQRLALHWHHEVEIVRFIKGDFELSVNMQDYKHQNRGIILFPSNAIHTMLLPKGAIEASVVFDPKIIQLESYDEAQSAISQILFEGKSKCLPVLDSSCDYFEDADKILSYIIDNANNNSSSSRLTVKAKLLELLALFYENGYFNQSEVNTSGIKLSKQQNFKALLKYMNDNYKKPLSITDGAMRLGVTEQYFCRYFKKATSMSFTEYLNDLRLTKAADDILNTDKPISDIYLEHGFENSGYFFKMFKRKYKITPLQYRKNSMLKV